MSENIDCDKCGFFATCEQKFCQYDWNLKEDKEESEFSDLDMKQAKSIILSGLRKQERKFGMAIKLKGLKSLIFVVRNLILKRIRVNDFKIIKILDYNQYKLVVTIEVDVE